MSNLRTGVIGAVSLAVSLVQLVCVVWIIRDLWTQQWDYVPRYVMIIVLATVLDQVADRNWFLGASLTFSSVWLIGSTW